MGTIAGSNLLFYALSSRPVSNLYYAGLQRGSVPPQSGPVPSGSEPNTLPFGT
jgi:hypothetical protein